VLPSTAATLSPPVPVMRLCGFFPSASKFLFNPPQSTRRDAEEKWQVSFAGLTELEDQRIGEKRLSLRVTRIMRERGDLNNSRFPLSLCSMRLPRHSFVVPRNDRALFWILDFGFWIQTLNPPSPSPFAKAMSDKRLRWTSAMTSACFWILDLGFWIQTLKLETRNFDRYGNMERYLLLFFDC
jgi:hypothetical protein